MSCTPVIDEPASTHYQMFIKTQAADEKVLKPILVNTKMGKQLGTVREVPASGHILQ